MEKVTIMALLEKYWQAETTLEEEKTLAEYFKNPDPEWEEVRALFVYFEEETRVTASPDFEARILHSIGAIDAPLRKMNPFRTGLTSAAAIIAAITVSLFLLRSDPNPTTKTAATKTITIKDTYDNPQQALAAVRHALLIASAHLNEGRKQITDKQ